LNKPHDDDDDDVNRRDGIKNLALLDFTSVFTDAVDRDRPPLTAFDFGRSQSNFVDDQNRFAASLRINATLGAYSL